MNKKSLLVLALCLMASMTFARTTYNSDGSIKYSDTIRSQRTNTENIQSRPAAAAAKIDYNIDVNTLLNSINKDTNKTNLNNNYDNNNR